MPFDSEEASAISMNLGDVVRWLRSIRAWYRVNPPYSSVLGTLLLLRCVLVLCSQSAPVFHDRLLPFLSWSSRSRMLAETTPPSGVLAMSKLPFVGAHLPNNCLA
jgi:hypothetical protein